MTHRGRISLAGLAAALFLGACWTFDAALAKAFQDAAAASAPQIIPSDPLRSQPFDKITLTDGSLLVVDPISPRPLPPLESSKTKRQQETVHIKGTNDEIPLGGNITLPSETPKKDAKAPENEPDPREQELARAIKIHLLGNTEARDFLLKRASIRTVEYFEDMLMAESVRLVLARDFARAFECLLRVKSRNPAWPGLDDRVNRLLLAEGTDALNAGNHEKGLRLLRELLERDRNFPGLIDQISSAYNGWISKAIELRQYARGRKLLAELEGMASGQPLVKEIKDRFVAIATRQAQKADSATGYERQDALLDALRIWPNLPDVESAYLKTFEAAPTLDVGVNDVPDPLGPWLKSPADARVVPLLYRPILGADTDDAKQGSFPGQLAASLQSSDLGRRLAIKVAPGNLWSDGSRGVSAVDLARSLIDRSDPNSPRYQARWAEILDRVDSPDEMTVEIRLNRPLVKIGEWLNWPAGPAHAGIDGRIATAQQKRLLVTDGVYRYLDSSENAIALGAIDTPDGADSAQQPRIKRIRELRFASPKAALGALVQGEISLLSHLPASMAASIASNDQIKLGRYKEPSVHFLAIDGRNPALRNRTLRRGISYLIDRSTLLADRVLRRKPDDSNAIADGPFARGSYANAPDVRPLEYNPALGFMLIAAARKELGGSRIRLNLEYPATAEARAVCPLLAEILRRAGIDVEVIELPESRLESELRAGRRFDLAYRAIRCEEPLLEAGDLLCPGYDAPPAADALASAASPRILQLLLQLDRAVEATTARGLAIQIDRESRDELPIIPLWQVVDHYAWRAQVEGPPETASRLYDGVESWTITPWVAKDSWTTP